MIFKSECTSAKDARNNTSATAIHQMAGPFRWNHLMPKMQMQEEKKENSGIAFASLKLSQTKSNLLEKWQSQKKKIQI